MNSNIKTYINELLHHYDCVIVAGFGGFVSRSMPANIANDGGIIFPPSKSILFNKNLTNNDGLLVNYLIEKDHLNYSQAVDAVHAFVANCKQELEQAKRLEFGALGFFYFDTEKNIQFEAKDDLNFLQESFGLPTLKIYPVVKEISTIKPTKELVDKKVVLDTKPNKTKKYLRVAALSLIAPILIASAWFSINQTQNGKHFLASLNPFSSKAVVTSNYKVLNYNDNYSIDFKQAETIETNADGYAYLKLNGKLIVATNLENNSAIDKTNVAVKTKVKTSSSNLQVSEKPFQVVLGCFGVKENVSKFISKLKTENINAVYAGLNEKGLHVVSAGGFDTKESANALVQQVKNQYPNAWVLKK